MKMLPSNTIKRTGGHRGDVFAAFLESDDESTDSSNHLDEQAGCGVHAIAEPATPVTDFLNWKKLH